MLNVVVVQGRLTRAPEERTLPSGDRLVAFDLTVPAWEDAPEGVRRAEPVPIAWFDPPAWVTQLDAGDEIVVSGRVRKRFYRAGARAESRTEVIARRGALAHQRGRVAQVLKEVAIAVTEG
jgi:single-strand DNA-binding protein